MAGNLAYDGGISANQAQANDTTGNTGNSHLLTAFLSGFAGGVKDQVSSVFKTSTTEVLANVAQPAQLAAAETASLANSLWFQRRHA